MEHILALLQNSGGGGAGIVGLLIQIIFYLGISALCFWKVFEKAGHPGWASIVPIYNVFILLQIAGRPWWWLILAIIPIVNIVWVVLIFIVNIDVAKAFGKGAGYGIGLTLLGIIFYPMLGFGSAQYQGSGGGVATATA